VIFTPIYPFDFNTSSNARNLKSTQFDALQGDGVAERRPIIPQKLKAELKRDDIFFENINVNTAEEVREILPQGYKTMDRGIKNYFSGIRIPTVDGIKLLGVRVSGGDKPYLTWAQDLRRGRVTLPVMAIRRESDEFFPEKFSPAHYHWFSKRFLDQDMTRMVLTYRPIPCKISYTVSIWAEFKRDLEYALYQIRSRFHPIAEFDVEDEYSRMSLILHYNGMTTAVDDETPADQRANKRYDISLQMEGYLPLPEKVVPSILGRVLTLKDGSEKYYGSTFDTVLGKSDYPITKP